jgi:NADH-quinone oxidoreductase subunit C
MESIDLQKLFDKVSQIIGDSPEDYTDIKNDVTYVIPSENIFEITKMLMEEFDCNHLSGITAQQREGQEDVVEVLYHFWHGTGFSFMMVLPLDAPELPSVKPILPGADFYEREVAEMFGVKFTGREETPRLLLPDNWSGGPPFIRSEVQDG